MTSNLNKSIVAILAVVVIASVGIYIFTNLPQERTDDNDDNGGVLPGQTVLTVTYNGEQINYTFEQLEAFPSYTGSGGYRTSKPSIKGIGNYTGVTIASLVDVFRDIPMNYSLIVNSSDGEGTTYNHSAVLGNVDIYNPDNASDATPISQGGLTMVLAYQFNGNYLNESQDGKLKIVFLDNEGSITNAGLWWKYVVSIEVIPE